MASSKKRHKAANLARKARLPQTAVHRHRDGDRRHRAAMAKAVQQAKAEKQFLQQLGAPVLPDEEPCEPEA